MMEENKMEERLYESMIQQETPQIGQNLEKVEEIFNLQLDICQKEFDKVIQCQSFIKLSIIQETAAYVVAKKLSEKIFESEQNENFEQIQNILINQKVKSVIKQIKEQWESQLTTILKNINYFIDLESWITQYQEECQFQTKKMLIDLEKKSKEKVEKYDFSEYLQIQMASFFMDTLKIQIIYFYTLKDFKEYSFELDYQYELEELNNHLNEIVFEQFKQKYSKLYKSNQSTVKACINSLELYIDQKVIEDKVSCNNNISNLIKSKIEYQKSIAKQIKDFLCIHYEINDICFSLYKNELLEIQQKIDVQYSKAIIQMKKELTNIRNTEFDNQMKKIKHLILERPFQNIQNKQDIINIIYYIMYYAQIQNNQQLKIIQNIFNYFFSLMEEDRTVFVQQVLQNVTDYENFKQQNANIIKEGAGQFVQILLQSKLIRFIINIFIQKFYQKIGGNYFYLFLTQFYMILSNIQVDFNKKIVNVDTYYGFLYELRYEILKPLNKQFPEHQITFFFNYLDSFFEKKIIYQFGTYSQVENIAQTQGFKIKFGYHNQDYDLMHLLRTEISKQELNHDEKIQQKFQSALKYLKTEYLNQPLPNIFHIKKISHCQKRSRNIIIAVSGFTSQDEDKQIKWKELDDLYPDSEIYALEYQSYTLQDVASSLKSNAVSSLFIPGGNLLKLMQFVAGSVIDNPFKKAFTQAELSGLYLAHFLFKRNLFPNCSISLIGFSLGTQVIASCLYEYKKLITFSKQPSVIASVIFMGGVVDTNFIKRTHLTEVVSHRVFNCYTKKDQILRYVLKTTYFFSNPIGLNPIEDQKNKTSKSKIINLNFTHLIDGHLPFMANITSVLYNTDFRQELLTKFKEDKQLHLVD